MELQSFLQKRLRDLESDTDSWVPDEFAGDTLLALSSRRRRTVFNARAQLTMTLESSKRDVHGMEWIT